MVSEEGGPYRTSANPGDVESHPPPPYIESVIDLAECVIELLYDDGVGGVGRHRVDFTSDKHDYPVPPKTVLIPRSQRVPFGVSGINKMHKFLSAGTSKGYVTLPNDLGKDSLMVPWHRVVSVRVTKRIEASQKVWWKWE